MTMTPETREELARAILGRTAPRAVDAIAPIIERLVAERMVAETERCANALRPVPFPTDYNYKQALAAIRSATR